MADGAVYRETGPRVGKIALDLTGRVVVLMGGLPYAGKSTRAREMSAELGFPIVCPDAFRVALHGQRFVPQAEGILWSVVRLAVEGLLYAGHDGVILDATNLTREQRARWGGTRAGYTVAVSWLDTSAEECLERARAADDRALFETIGRMARIAEPPGDDELIW